MALWGGYILQPRRTSPPDGTTHTHASVHASMNSNDIHLLFLESITWSRVKTSSGARPQPRGGHTLTLVGNKLLIYGGGVLVFDGEAWRERDMNDVHWLGAT